MTDETALRLLADAFLTEHAEDAGRRLEQLEPARAAQILDELSAERAQAIVRTMAPLPAATYLAAMKQAPAVVEALPADLAARVLRHIEPADRERLLDEVSVQAAEAIRKLAAYPEDSVAAFTDARDWAAASDWTVGDARKRLLEWSEPHVYIVNRSHEVVAVVEIDAMRDVPADQKLMDLARREVTRLRAEASIADVKTHPAWLEVDMLPAVDPAGKLVGLLRHKAVRRATAGGTQPPGNPMFQAIMGLSELYWTGMTTVLTGVSSRQPKVEARRDSPDN